MVDLKTGRQSLRHLISVRSIAALRGIQFTPNGLRIGALTTLAELDRHAEVRRVFPAIHDATSQMAAVQIRNMATVGGNVACAVPCADLPPVLLVLGATVSARSASGERVVPVESFYVGLRRTVLASEEILVSIGVPVPPAHFGAAYSRFSLREGNAVAVAAIAASIRLTRDGIIADARIALGAVSPTPRLATSAQKLLVDKKPSDPLLREASRMAMEQCEPISDVRGSAEFRREFVGVLTQRALSGALRRAQEKKT